MILYDATGWDARLLALAATASKVAANGDVGLPLFTIYALMGVGLPSAS
jgi:hypothetical protein